MPRHPRSSPLTWVSSSGAKVALRYIFTIAARVIKDLRPNVSNLLKGSSNMTLETIDKQESAWSTQKAIKKRRSGVPRRVYEEQSLFFRFEPCVVWTFRAYMTISAWD